MKHAIRLTAVASLGALALGMAACTPAADDDAEAPAASTTVVEAPAPAPVVVEKEVAVPTPTPPIVVERPAGDTTTVRAGEKGIEVETTNR
jgi:hypothetical protein